MAAPQRRYRVSTPPGPRAHPGERRRRGGLPGEAAGRKAAGRRRRFAVLVVVPVMLMLGSVYMQTVSAGLGGKVADLEEQVARAEARGEKLEVRVAELSGPGRIRSLASEELQMREPGAADMKVYAKHGEDGRPNGEEEKAGESR